MFIHAPSGNVERLSFITRPHENFGNKGIRVTSKIHEEERIKRNERAEPHRERERER